MQICKWPSLFSELTKYETPLGPTMHDFNFLLVAKPESQLVTIEAFGAFQPQYAIYFQNILILDHQSYFVFGFQVCSEGNSVIF